MMHAIQTDLFAQRPELPISPRHPENHRCFAMESTHVERFVDHRVACEIRIARDNTGYHWAICYEEPFAGSAGPVFANRPPLDTFDDARAQAIRRLREIAPGRCEDLRKLIERIVG